MNYFLRRKIFKHAIQSYKMSLSVDNKKIEKKTSLTLMLTYSCSLLMFLFALFCFYIIDIRGIIFKALITFSLLNMFNFFLFFRHKNLVILYNIFSVLIFILSFLICLYSGGINSRFTMFIVLLIFAGYFSNSFYGKLWLIIAPFSVIILYIIGLLNNKTNIIPHEISSSYNLFISLIIILVSGLVGGLMNKNHQKLFEKKKVIEKQNILLEKQKEELIKVNREKTAMLKAVQNRVKKSLKVVQSLLKRDSTGIDDDKVLEAVEEAQKRVLYMAIFHEKIFQPGKETQMNIKEVIDLIISDLKGAYAKGNKIIFNVDVKDVDIEMKTMVPLGLVVNELITNSLKYAFKNQDRGEIKVQIKATDNKCYEMIVGDNGIGRKENNKNTGIGTKLIEIFTKQLNGSLERLDQSGTVYKLVFNTID